jgi:hypothetical protein
VFGQANNLGDGDALKDTRREGRALEEDSMSSRTHILLVILVDVSSSALMSANDRERVDLLGAACNTYKKGSRVGWSVAQYNNGHHHHLQQRVRGFIWDLMQMI